MISITELLDDTAMGRLMQAIIECINEFYSENLGAESLPIMFVGLSQRRDRFVSCSL